MKFGKLNNKNGWPKVKLGVCCDLIRGVNFQNGDTRQEKTDSFIPLLRAGNISTRLDLENDLVWVPSRLVSSEQRLKAGDIAICLSSGSPLIVGKTAQLEYDWSGTVGAFCGIVRPTGADAGYLAHWFRSPQFFQWRNSQARGANIQNLRFSELSDLEIIFPPLVEQRRLATQLQERMSEVERARAAVQAQLEAAQTLPAALLRDIFAGDTASRWPIASLGDVSEIAGGMQKTPDRAPHKFHKKFLTVRNVQRGYLDLSNVERFEVTPVEFERLRLQQGDLLIVEGNGSVAHIGRNALFKEDGEWIHQNHIIRVRLSQDRLMPEFVSEYLNSEAGCTQMLEKAKTTTGLYTLSTKKIASLFVPIPSLAEQRKVAARLIAELTAARKLVETLESRLAEIELLPATLLRSAFNGN